MVAVDPLPLDAAVLREAQRAQPHTAVATIAAAVGDAGENDALVQRVLRVADEHRTTFAVVLSDAAPATTGHASRDAALALRLVLGVVDVAQRVLPPAAGALVCKFRQGGDAEREFREALRQAGFSRVKLHKPAASRASSAEIYVVAARGK